MAINVDKTYHIHTERGPQAFRGQVLQRLVDGGIVWMDGDRYTATAAALEGAVFDFGGCDFCSDVPVHAVLDTPDFFLAGDEQGGLASTGGWACCASCFHLVQGGQPALLLTRCLQANGTPPELVPVHRDLHNRFWKSYTGQFKLRPAKVSSVDAAEMDRWLKKVHGLRQHQTPWMEAIEMQYACLGELNDLHRRENYQQVDGVIRGSWQLDMEVLKRADSYAWGPDPVAACRLASKSLPRGVKLTRDLIPGSGYGWWYFPGPIPVKTTSMDDGTCALLWGWVHHKKHEPMIVFTAMVMSRLPGKNGRIRFAPTPSQQFFWNIGETIEQMVERTAQEYDVVLNQPSVQKMHERQGSQPFPKQDVLTATADLALFYVAACLWLQQKILSWTPGHIERHRRKQLVRENKLDAPPTDVKVVALRRVEHQAGPASGPGEPVAWSCRWMVDGHWRNQFYPSTGDHKPIFIMPFVKGPADKPLKVPSHKVYTVVR